MRTAAHSGGHSGVHCEARGDGLCEALCSLCKVCDANVDMVVWFTRTVDEEWCTDKCFPFILTVQY